MHNKKKKEEEICICVTGTMESQLQVKNMYNEPLGHHTFDLMTEELLCIIVLKMNTQNIIVTSVFKCFHI